MSKGVNVKNFEIAKILKEIAIFLEMDDVQFKPRAYEKAAKSVESMEERCGRNLQERWNQSSRWKSQALVRA